jgi:hypothetical protein
MANDACYYKAASDEVDQYNKELDEKRHKCFLHGQYWDVRLI